MDDPFTVVSLNFKRLGAISVEDYLSSSKYDSLQVDYSFGNLNLNSDAVRRALEGDHVAALEPQSAGGKPVENATKDEDKAFTNAFNTDEPIELLHSQSMRYFPKVPIDDIFKWELEKDSLLLKGGKCTTWKAKLTICKPDGETMSIDSCQSEKPDLARNDAAAKAIRSGAMKFIASGASRADVSSTTGAQAEYGSIADSSSSKPVNLLDSEDNVSKKEKKKRKKQKKGATNTTIEEPAIVPSDSNVTANINQVEALVAQHQCPNSCLRWYQHTDNKLENTPGFVLLVKLSDNSYRIYSTTSECDTAVIAQEECARIALAEGLGEYLRLSDGSTTGSTMDNSTHWNDPQQFYDALGPAFRARFGDQPLAKLQPINWLNTSLKKVKGSRLVHSFQLVRGNGDNRNLLGCILRFQRDRETRSYFVEPRFKKEKDAKTAVCLQAMSEGAGDYFRSLEAILEASVSGKMKDLAKRIRTALQPDRPSQPTNRDPTHTYEIKFHVDRDAYGATMTVKTDPHGQDGREYTVPYQYRCEAHAEVAVLCVAARDGAIELVRFGHSIPTGYVPVLAREVAAELSKQEVQFQSVSEVEPGQVFPDPRARVTKPAASAPSFGIPVNNTAIPPQFSPPFALSQYPDVLRSTGPSYSPFASQQFLGQPAILMPGLYHAQDFLHSRTSGQIGTSFGSGPGSVAGGSSRFSQSAASALPSSSKRPFPPDSDTEESLKLKRAKKA
ncbi:hypothetical protein PM082_021084 [Marasmius tenuissimus]|nr:hypothetical protein PM082_021084 [Marasmius tenuissimus]